METKSNLFGQASSSSAPILNNNLAGPTEKTMAAAPYSLDDDGLSPGQCIRREDDPLVRYRVFL